MPSKLICLLAFTPLLLPTRRFLLTHMCNWDHISLYYFLNKMQGQQASPSGSGFHLLFSLHSPHECGLTKPLSGFDPHMSLHVFVHAALDLGHALHPDSHPFLYIWKITTRLSIFGLSTEVCNLLYTASLAVHWGLSLLLPFWWPQWPWISFFYHFFHLPLNTDYTIVWCNLLAYTY